MRDMLTSSSDRDYQGCDPLGRDEDSEEYTNIMDLAEESGCTPEDLPKKRKGGARKCKAWRSPEYMRWISQLPCCMCVPIVRFLATYGDTGIRLSDPAHSGSDGGTSMKSSDSSCIPLCRMHHNQFDGQEKCPSGEVGRAAFIRYYGLPVDDIVAELNHEWTIRTGKPVGKATKGKAA